MATFNGYHATTRDSARNIVRIRQFRKSVGDDHWLGNGIYFFDDLYWVHWWCSDVKHIRPNSRAYVECHINVGEDRLLDLRTDDGQECLTVAYDLAEAYSRQIGHPVETKDISDGAALNHLAKKTPIDVIVAEYPWKDEKYAKSKILKKIQTQISVRNERCLSGFKMCNI